MKDLEQQVRLLKVEFFKEEDSNTIFLGFKNADNTKIKLLRDIQEGGVDNIYEIATTHTLKNITIDCLSWEDYFKGPNFIGPSKHCANLSDLKKIAQITDAKVSSTASKVLEDFVAFAKVNSLKFASVKDLIALDHEFTNAQLISQYQEQGNKKELNNSNVLEF